MNLSCYAFMRLEQRRDVSFNHVNASCHMWMHYTTRACDIRGGGTRFLTSSTSSVCVSVCAYTHTNTQTHTRTHKQQRLSIYLIHFQPTRMMCSTDKHSTHWCCTQTHTHTHTHTYTHTHNKDGHTYHVMRWMRHVTHECVRSHVNASCAEEGRIVWSDECVMSHKNESYHTHMRRTEERPPCVSDACDMSHMNL